MTLCHSRRTAFDYSLTKESRATLAGNSTTTPLILSRLILSPQL